MSNFMKRFVVFKEGAIKANLIISVMPLIIEKGTRIIWSDEKSVSNLDVKSDNYSTIMCKIEACFPPIEMP